ncbi:NlpC/P60 family protein [Antrihabitans cavernicola]|uniref:NlpC/P60 family protein n=1 Tax=Antrihabitans cavernicola TaxID=2495913 RepID=A0A5A7SBY3_9NOCA|nr:NlpC/P60 family protein [Spelaeibacter cavernicola]KAA0022103.1 NlpC/P60 family protein [Spelaeibacter cavernicola]
MQYHATRRVRRTLAIAALSACLAAIPAAPAFAVPTGSSSGSGDTGSGTGSAGSSSGSGSSGSSSGSANFALPISSPAGLIALTAAVTQTGKPYEWGGTGPNAWDCSGLVQWAFHQAGVNLPRTSEQMAHAGYPVPLWALSPGDVVVLNSDASHVGIYVGFGQVFNAYGNGVPVGLAPLSQWEINSIRRF